MARALSILSPWLRTTSHGNQFAALIVVQTRGTVLGAERVDYADTRDERVMHVVVKLVERLLQIRVRTNLRTDRNRFACRRHDEMLMRRNWVKKNAWWISKA